MSQKPFSQAQQQSIVGVLLIFSKLTYKFARGLWPLLFVLFMNGFSFKKLIYSLIGFLLFITLGLIYSYIYYLKFQFHINYKEKEFVLVKGVFSTQTTTIPFDKIQQVDLERSVLQRLIGVYSIIIDTAGSSANEIEISALSQVDANQLALILTKAKEEALSHNEDGKIKGEEEQIIAKDAAWTYKLSVLNLLKVGLTKNFLRGLAIMLAFVLSAYSQITSFFDETLEGYFNEQFYPQIEPGSYSVMMLVFIVIALIVFSIITTVIGTFIKYFRLKIQQTTSRIEIEMGLRTNTKVSFQARRLQRLKISTNPIHKRLNIYQAYFSLASSDDSLGKSQIAVPGLNPETIEKIKLFLYGNSSFETNKTYRPHRAWFNRRVIFSTVPILGLWLFNFFGNNLALWTGLLTFSLIYLLLVIPYQYFLFKRFHINISDDFLNINSGFWNKKSEFIELYKMEGLSIKQPFWYRGRKLYNIIFHTAGGDIFVRAIPSYFLKEINFFLYKIESSQKAWM